jgi:three-Cys-motif partner protein
MPPNIEHYRGREQSFIKHLFLQKYLENAAPKLFLGRSTVVNFVDAFAGPWGNTDKDTYLDTSFSLAISTLEGVRQLLAERYAKNFKVRFRLCERNQASVARLEAFASSNPAVDIEVFGGRFEENLPAIRAKCCDVPNSFTITFIDPTGWNVDSRPVFEFLKEVKGEVLFNFMAEHVNRHAGWAGVADSFGRFLADPDWRPTFETLPAEWSNERKILTLLERRIKQAGAALYLPNFAIPKPREERTKMRLVLGTYNHHGVEVFRTVQEEVKKLRSENGTT